MFRIQISLTNVNRLLNSAIFYFDCYCLCKAMDHYFLGRITNNRTNIFLRINNPKSESNNSLKMDYSLISIQRNTQIACSKSSNLTVETS